MRVKWQKNVAELDRDPVNRIARYENPNRRKNPTSTAGLESC
jgi:hypothetical protein